MLDPIFIYIHLLDKALHKFTISSDTIRDQCRDSIGDIRSLASHTTIFRRLGHYGQIRSINTAWSQYREAGVSLHQTALFADDMASLFCDRCRIGGLYDDHYHQELLETVYRKNRMDLVDLAQFDKYMKDLTTHMQVSVASTFLFLKEIYQLQIQHLQTLIDLSCIITP
jgi:hypothetical protein